MNSDRTYREAHAEGLIEISFYNRDVPPSRQDGPPSRELASLHLIAVRTDDKITPGSTITSCGLAITPEYNEWRPRDEAEALLRSVSGCPVCAAHLAPADR